MSPPRRRIVGIIGYAGVGKDTAAAYIANKYGYSQRAFADKLRETALLLGDTVIVGRAPWPYFWRPITYTEAVTSMGYETAKRTYPEVRKYLVKMGHGLRRVLGDSLWLDQVLGAKEDPTKIVISDVRYQNEADAILAQGGFLIYLERLGVGPANATEAATTPFHCAHATILNSGTKEDLYESIDRLFAV